MARCRKCGEKLVGAAKFCVTCGAPVPEIPATLESAAFSQPLPKRPPEPVTEPPKTKASVPAPAPANPTATDPLGAGVRGSNYGPPPPAPHGTAPFPQPPPPQQQSWGGQPYGAPVPAQAPNAAYPYAPQQGYQPPPAGYGPYAPPPYGPPFVAGGRVLVLWADGNRYPGIVHQVAPGQCLIVFPDGQQRWVEFQYLTPAR
jgi:hypothetical protein